LTDVGVKKGHNCCLSLPEAPLFYIKRLNFLAVNTKFTAFFATITNLMIKVEWLAAAVLLILSIIGLVNSEV
jgi:hypothetical protein